MGDGACALRALLLHPRAALPALLEAPFHGFTTAGAHPAPLRQRLQVAQQGLRLRQVLRVARGSCPSAVALHASNRSWPVVSGNSLLIAMPTRAHSSRARLAGMCASAARISSGVMVVMRPQGAQRLAHQTQTQGPAAPKRAGVLRLPSAPRSHGACNWHQPHQPRARERRQGKHVGTFGVRPRWRYTRQRLHVSPTLVR